MVTPFNPPAGVVISGDEQLYYAHKCALLDPAAHVFVALPNKMGTSYSETVPQGTTWYLRNAWWMSTNAQNPPGNNYKFHRDPALRAAAPLPPGTTLTVKNTYASDPFWYVCKPELVIGNYPGDTRDFYYARRRQLISGLPQVDLAVDANSISANIPNANLMIMHASVHDANWLILSNGGNNSINLMPERGDNAAPIRFTNGDMMLPIPAGVFGYIEISTTGGEGPSSDPPNGSISYCLLPNGW